MTDAAEHVADELYGMPPGEFTAARDERAKQLRADGDREAAAEVKALRKPTVAAWAVNALARRRRADLGRLLDAGEQLRAAQSELLAGGDRSAFQDAAANERELVAKLAGEAAQLVADAGERPGAGLEEKVAGTLHAAALDEETAEEVRAGRLVREREAIGGFGGFGGFGGGSTGGAGGAGGPPADEPKPSKPRKARKPPPKKKTDGAAARRREQLAAARTDERHARRELEAAAKMLGSAESRADSAEAHAADAVERAKTASERLKEARRKATAARKAHARAERALKAAESA